MAKSLYDSRWRARRAQQLRLHPMCRFCMEIDGRLAPATVADHVTPHRGDLELFKGPLQSLCQGCHNSRKQQLETTGHIRGCDLHGIPLDPGHPWRQELERERAGALEGPGGRAAFPKPSDA